MAPKVRQSLLQAPRFLDVPPEVLLAEGVFLLSVLGIFGYGLTEILVSLALLVPPHLVIARLTQDEPQALGLLADALSYRRFYPSRAHLLAPAPESRSSIPRT